jgi:ATP-dependent RNA helicase DDX60
MDSTHIAFDDTVDSSQDNPAAAQEEKMNAVEALKCIDDRWYKTIAGKKARWMDLIGDYAGNERFILDGNKTLVWF